MGVGAAKGIDNVNHPNLWPCRNQLKNALLLRLDPSSSTRPYFGTNSGTDATIHAKTSTSTDKCVMLP